MGRFAAVRRAVLAGVCVLALGACSLGRDPASEAPVDPAAGLYQISQSGAAFTMQTEKQPRDTYCLKQSKSASFPYLLAENYYAALTGCRTSREPRQGNLIAGEIKCAADPKLASGANRFVYSGEVASDRVAVSVQMKLEANFKDEALSEKEAAQLRVAAKAMEQMRFNLEARRVGDCG